MGKSTVLDTLVIPTSGSDGDVLTIQADGTYAAEGLGSVGYLNVVQTWTRAQTSSVATLSVVSTEVDDDTSAGPLKQKITLAADLSDATLSNGIEGQSRIWYILQDGTGGRTITWSGIDGTEPTIDTTADTLTVVEFEYVASTGWRFV